MNQRLILLALFALSGGALPSKEYDPRTLYRLRNTRLVQISSFDSTGGNNDRINIPAGKTATLAFVQGPGTITRIWMTIDSRDEYFLRRLVLRIYWDEERDPSVEVPLGDFFGNGFEYVHYASQFLGMTSGGYFCLFPMPFNRSARIEVANETGQECYALYYQIDIQMQEDAFDEGTGYFHAQWRRDLRTSPDSNYTVLEARGRGHFVGLNLQMESYTGSPVYLEGDEMVFVDGESFPSIYGTGTEDYFNSGWYFRNGTFAAPTHGLILKNDSLGQTAAYRFHVGDAIPFRRSIRFTIEHGHGNEAVCDYASTAYWYQLEPHKPFPPLPKAALRIPLRMHVPNGLLEAETLGFEASFPIEIEDMSGHGPEWSGLKQLAAKPENAGDAFTLFIPAGEERAYTVELYHSIGPDYGRAAVSCGRRRLAVLSGYDPLVRHGGKVDLGRVEPREGMIELDFRITGKDERSGGFRVGLDGFRIEPVREYIREWMLIGPFPNPRESDVLRYGLDAVYPPETEIRLDRSYAGAEGLEVKWKKTRTPESGYFSLWRLFDPYEMVVVYALTHVYSPVRRTVDLLLGSDDGAKVFLNGVEVFRYLGVRIAQPDQDRIPLDLAAGWNTLLLKIENNFGGYGFYARLLDREGSLLMRIIK